MHTAATAETDPRVSLGEVLSALQSGSERTCADLMTDAALFLLNVSNALSTDTDVDARNEVLIVAALQGSHIAFERVDFHDGELRATVALRLCSLLEHRGGGATCGCRRGRCKIGHRTGKDRGDACESRVFGRAH